MRNTTKILRIANVALLVLVCGSAANAQVFGSRPQLPNPAANSPMGGTSISAGASSSLIPLPPQGSDRFLRSSRTSRDFVGRNRADIRSFIGAQQALAVGQVRSATEGLRANPGASSKKINQPLPAQPAKGLYYPKLALDASQDDSTLRSDLKTADSNMQSGELDPLLIERIQRVAGSGVQLSLNANKITIRGQATSARKAELAIQMLQFEPGIDVVDNQLK
jgi:hypothetical protein